jgi:phosphate starvation-inducible PhoH-like protein
MENSSSSQMYMLLTRIGINSRMVITGDLKQNKNNEVNGLQNFISKYKISQDIKDIKLIELDELDIQRSELVKQIVTMYK